MIWINQLKSKTIPSNNRIKNWWKRHYILNHNVAATMKQARNNNNIKIAQTHTERSKPIHNTARYSEPGAVKVKKFVLLISYQKIIQHR